MKIIYRINEGDWGTREFDDWIRYDDLSFAELIAETYCKRQSNYDPVVVDIMQRCHFVRFNVDVISVPKFEAAKLERPYK